MEFIDSHTHLYLPEFDNDRATVIENSIKSGIKIMLLPNIDSGTITSMLEVCKTYPENCFPMIGLHPTSIQEDYLDQLKSISDQLRQNPFIAIGEVGLDLHWDKTFLLQQKDAFVRQIELSRNYQLPLVIHCREAFTEIIDILKEVRNQELYIGVFHCFSGTVEEAKQIISLGFKLGIGGVVTFKKTTLHEVVQNISLSEFILETDAPYLAPVPYRGKRNESAYIPLIAEKIAELKNIPVEEVARVTTETAKSLFKLK